MKVISITIPFVTCAIISILMKNVYERCQLGRIVLYIEVGYLRSEIEG